MPSHLQGPRCGLEALSTLTTENFSFSLEVDEVGGSRERKELTHSWKSVIPVNIIQTIQRFPILVHTLAFDIGLAPPPFGVS